MAENKMLYFWYKLTRVSQRFDGKHSFFATTGTDAETTGRFDDSVTRIGYATIYPGQTASQVFELYKSQLDDDCNKLGFNGLQLVLIGKREYDSFRRTELREIDAFLDDLAAPAFAGKVRR